MAIGLRHTSMMLAGIVLILVTPPLVGAETPPASERSRKEIVKLAGSIEENPLAKNARKQRSKALQIIRDEPALKIVPCRALLGELTMSRSLGALELRAHMQIAAARYLADHPAATSNDVETAVAGLEGVVHAYASMKRNDLRVQIPEAEALTEVYSSGNLSDYAADALANCDR